MLQLSRCTLKKGNKTIIFQGMIHGTSEPLFDWLKRDMKKQIRNGYRIFHEGVRRYEDDVREKKFSEKELEVDKCRKFIDDIKNEAMKSLGLTIQFSVEENGDDDEKEYPDNAINIDISYVEYIRQLSKLLDKENIDCKKFADIFAGISHEEIISKAVNVTENLLSGKITLKELDAKAMTVDFFRITSLVQMDYRNKIAAKKTDAACKKKKINKVLVYYGESHVEGITDLLVNKYGWELVKVTHIDSQNPIPGQKRI